LIFEIEKASNYKALWHLFDRGHPNSIPKEALLASRLFMAPRPWRALDLFI
jgi:hypothetical protein